MGILLDYGRSDGMDGLIYFVLSVGARGRLACYIVGVLFSVSFLEEQKERGKNERYGIVAIVSSPPSCTQ